MSTHVRSSIYRGLILKRFFVLFSRCIGDVKVGVSKLLNFVNTVKHLATIRDTVWDLLSQVKK